MKLLDHEIASCWPLMNEADLNALAKSIKANGQRLPVILYEGKILDGRNRSRACEQVGAIPWTEDFKGGDPVQFAKDINEQRRHETPSQRALIAAKLANIMQPGRPKSEIGSKEPIKPLVSIDRAAEIMNVGRSPVKRGKKVLAEATPEVVAKVEAGTMTLGAAMKTIEPKEEMPQADVPPKKMKKMLFAHAEKHCAKAMLHLKKVTDHDPTLIPAFKKIIKYCQHRINLSK